MSEKPNSYTTHTSHLFNDWCGKVSARFQKGLPGYECVEGAGDIDSYEGFVNSVTLGWGLPVPVCHKAALTCRFTSAMADFNKILPLSAASSGALSIRLFTQHSHQAKIASELRNLRRHNIITRCYPLVCGLS